MRAAARKKADELVDELLDEAAHDGDRKRLAETLGLLSSGTLRSSADIGNPYIVTERTKQRSEVTARPAGTEESSGCYRRVPRFFN